MSCKSYLIKLKPLGNFYFGGERSFREYEPKATEAEDREKDKDETLSYIVESNYFPQQTALLGMLRFLLLRKSDFFENGKIKAQDVAKAAVLIGPSSFMLGQDKCEFGNIESIGTCFISNGNDFLLPMPLDYPLDVKFSIAIEANYCNRSLTLPSVTYRSNGELYSAKNGVYDKLLLGGSVIDYDYSEEKDPQTGEMIGKGVFIKDRRIGIDRDIKTGKVEKNALYKQEFYRLVNGYEFAFTAQLKDDIDYTAYNNEVVELGGDNSKFLITFEQQEQEIKIEHKNISNSQGAFKAVLLSDALINDVSLSTFSISANTPMRFMETNIKTTSDYSRITKSKRRSLYKKGSVFYFEGTAQREAFIEAVKDNKNFKKIGYNNIQKID